MLEVISREKDQERFNPRLSFIQSTKMFKLSKIADSAIEEKVAQSTSYYFIFQNIPGLIDLQLVINTQLG